MSVASQAIYVIFTLYMLLILLRWFGPWISFDLDESRLRWAGRLVDPLIDKLRQILPPMGPVDFGPIAALVLVWFVRQILVAMASPAGPGLVS